MCMLYLASLACYCEPVKMTETLDFYEEQINCELLNDTVIILFLNKRDLFQVQIERIPLTVSFPEFEGDSNDFEEALSYIRDQFQTRNHTYDRHIYSHLADALDGNLVQRVFNDIQHISITIALRRSGLL